MKAKEAFVDYEKTKEAARVESFQAEKEIVVFYKDLDGPPGNSFQGNSIQGKPKLNSDKVLRLNVNVKVSDMAAEESCLKEVSLVRQLIIDVTILSLRAIQMFLTLLFWLLKLHLLALRT